MTADKFKLLGLDRNFMPMGLDELVKIESVKPSYQSVSFAGLKPRKSEVDRLVKEGVREHEAILSDMWQQFYNVELVGFKDGVHKRKVPDNPPDLVQADDKLPVIQWQTLDIMYYISKDADKKQFNRSFNKSDIAWKNSKQNIVKHLAKADIVPMYLDNFDDETLAKIIGFVLSLSKEQQQQIVFITEKSL